MSESHAPGGGAAPPVGGSAEPPVGAGAWERGLLSELARASLREQRRARRWGIFFKILTFTYLTVVLVLYTPGDLFSGVEDDERHTAVIDLDGVIAAGTDASADKIATGLRAAFEDERTAGVIIRINSPGGSPVQSGYIYDEIRRLRKKYPEIPLHAVVADLCASGGYYVAAAADKIYVDESSIVGSIGVLMNGFGFVEAMHMVGVERRLHTAGENKGFMDPFSPERDSEVAHLKGVLGTLHKEFIRVVREGRGERLRETDAMFSGLVWTGQESIELGLADAIGSTGSVARNVIGAERTVDFTPRAGLVERLVERFGASVTRHAATQLGINGVQFR